MTKDKLNKILGGIAVGSCFIVGVYVVLAPAPDRPRFDPADPTTITRLRGDGSAQFNQGRLQVTFPLDRHMLTVGTGRTVFLTDTTSIFRNAFRSDAVDEVCVEATASFRSVRGEDSRGRAASACMTRRNAATITWQNFQPANLRLVADSFWLHPSFSE